MANVVEASLVGSTLGDKYAIEAMIGVGAMGTVYRAHQISLHKTVAIKVLHRPLAEQPAFVERFEREAFSASRLDHPNSLRVLDFGKSDGLLYLVMEFAEGEDLMTVMQREWPFDDPRIVDIMSQALLALATAHDLGIVHRDLKPENILLLRGTDDEGKPIDVVKVCDFGIAKLMGTLSEKNRSFSRHLTTEGFAIGTPDYMSPEQARGQDIDGRSDLYSIGVVLYQLLVGKLPFTGDTALGVVVQHISDPPPPPSSHAKVHERLEAICMRALSKDPKDRFENAREMRRALRGALEPSGEPLKSTPAPPLVYPTDMTSVPAGRTSTPPSPPDADVRSRFFGLRRALSPRARVAASATLLGVVALVLSARRLSTRPADRPAVLVTSGDAVVANPSSPITEPTPSLGGVAPAPPTGEPAVPTSHQVERSERTADTHRIDRVVARSSANAPPAVAGPIVGAGKSLSPMGSSPRALVAQPGSTSSAEAVAGSGSSESESSRSTSPEQNSLPPPIAKVALPPADPTPPSTEAAFDPSHASVAVGAISTTGGIPGSKVRAAIARIPFSSCYRKSLSGRASAATMDASLRITIDVSGRVSTATLSSDGNLPGLRACIEQEARGISIRDVDTGDGSAVVSLTFSPR